MIAAIRVFYNACFNVEAYIWSNSSERPFLITSIMVLIWHIFATLIHLMSCIVLPLAHIYESLFTKND